MGWTPTIDHDFGAFVGTRSDVSLDAVSLSGRNDWTHQGVGGRGVTHLEMRCICGETGDELVVAAAVHDGAGWGGADLAGVE